MKRLKNKVAIITGAAGGLGSSQALLFAQEGARVFLTDIQQEGLIQVVNQIRSSGGIADFMVHDVTSEEDWEAVIAKTLELYGGINVLVNNAGITGNILNSLLDTSVAEFKRVME